MASAFEKNPINLSKPFPSSQELKKELKIDTSIYAEHKLMYIKEAGTPERPIWDIFADYLDDL